MEVKQFHKIHLIYLLIALLFGIIITESCRKKNSNWAITPVTFNTPAGWPEPAYNFTENPLSEEGIALGRKIFYDPSLSADGTISCASCHIQATAFTHTDHNLGHGVHHQFSKRNPTAIFNMAWYKSFTMEGSVKHLDEQPIIPFTLPNEMGETMQNIIQKMKKNQDYVSKFKAAFGSEQISTEKIGKAISQFVLTLVSDNSKYDKVKRGEAVFNLAEQLGYEIFIQKCASCHQEPFFTDFSYRNIGLTKDPILNDLGRMHFTNSSEDSLKFRVPSLRNIAFTPPYMHDGRFFGLTAVFDHYKNGVVQSPTTDASLRNGIQLSNFEIGQLTSFLLTLSDSTFISDKRFSAPQ